MTSINNLSNSHSQMHLSHHVARKPNARFSLIKACALGTLLFPLVADALKKFSEPYQCTRIIKSEKYEGESRYSGMCVDNLEAGTKEIPHGKGRLEQANGDIYTGNWEYGKRHGSMLMDLKNHVFAAEFENDKLVSYSAKGKVPESERIEVIQTRNGDTVFLNQDKAFEIKENQVVFSSEGGKLVIDLNSTDDEVVKQTMILPSGRIESFEGRQVITLKDGERFEGHMENGLLQGAGKLYLTDGTIVEGKWKDNLIHGWSIEYRPNGVTVERRWEHGKQHGLEVYSTPDGGTLECTWINGIKSDKNIWIQPDGTKTEEHEKDGKRHGQMTILYPNGTKIVGHWENNLEHGWVTQYNPEGKIVEKSLARNGQYVPFHICYVIDRIFGDFISNYFC